MASNEDFGSEFDFIEEPSEKYICPVTFELLLDPVQTNFCCGHRLSRAAAEQLQTKGKPCPMCKKTPLRTTTVEPPKSGHYGDGHFVLSREVVLFFGGSCFRACAKMVNVVWSVYVCVCASGYKSHLWSVCSSRKRCHLLSG